MKRTVALEHLKAALIQGDTAKATRLYIENRISRSVYNDYYRRYFRPKTEASQ